MLTQQEISALIDIINKAPKSQAEVLWCQSVILRLQQEAERAEMAERLKAQEGNDGPDGTD